MDYRDKICTLIHLSKRRYYDTFFENNTVNMKKICQGISKLLHRRKKKFKVISALKDFNDRKKIVMECSRIPNIIKEHFTTIGNRLSNNLPIPPKNHLDYVDKCKSSISSYLFRHVLPEYYLYRMMNLMVYTPHLPNVQLPS